MNFLEALKYNNTGRDVVSPGGSLYRGHSMKSVYTWLTESIIGKWKLVPRKKNVR